jgi:hypothetical protein
MRGGGFPASAWTRRTAVKLKKRPSKTDAHLLELGFPYGEYWAKAACITLGTKCQTLITSILKFVQIQNRVVFKDLS